MALPLPPLTNAVPPLPAGVTRIPPQSGVGFRLATGQLLRITDPQGEQVADVTAFSANDLAETLSSGRSVDYAGSILLTTGNILYSNRSNPLFTVVEDTVGRHDILLTPCSTEMFRILYRHEGVHLSCFENLRANLEPFGVDADRIASTFNVFMNVEIDAGGSVRVLPPRSRAGDYLTLRAEMDLVVGVTACSAELSNHGAFKPIDLEVVPA